MVSAFLVVKAVKIVIPLTFAKNVQFQPKIIMMEHVVVQHLTLLKKVLEDFSVNLAHLPVLNVQELQILAPIAPEDLYLMEILVFVLMELIFLLMEPAVEHVLQDAPYVAVLLAALVWKALS